MAAAGISAICLAGFSLVVIRGDGVPQRIDATIRQAVLANSAIKTTWAYPDKCQANYRRKLGTQDFDYILPDRRSGAIHSALLG